MNRIIHLFCLLLCCGGIFAKTEVQVKLQTTTRDSVVVIEKIYFDRDQIYAHPNELRKLKQVIDLLKNDTTQHVFITGFSDHFGGDAVNDRFSFVRAQAIADYIKLHKIPSDQMTYSGEGIDRVNTPKQESRRVEISRMIKIVETVAPQVQETTAPPAEVEVVEQDTIVEQQEATPAVQTEARQFTPFTLRSNLLYFAGGLFNLGLGYRHNDWNYTVQGGYSPFSSAKWNKNLGGWFVSPEVQYFVGKNKKGYVGLQFLAGGCDLKFADTGYDGNVLFGGVTGGYKLELNKHFDMDFSLGLGYGSLKYDTYKHVKPDTKVILTENLKRNMLLPTQAGVTLIWKID